MNTALPTPRSAAAGPATAMATHRRGAWGTVRLTAAGCVLLAMLGCGTTVPIPAIPPSPASPPARGIAPQSSPTADHEDAVDAATRFAGEYLTHKHGETRAGYLARLRPLITPELGQVLSRRPLSEPAQAGPREAQEVRNVTPRSLTVIVAVGIEGTPRIEELAITAVLQGDRWKVSDMRHLGSAS